MELHVPALIPETYLADVPARLMLYKRIASAADSGALRELQVEMIDRFGLLPAAVKNLFALAELRLLAQHIGITRLDLGPQGGRVEFAPATRTNPVVVIHMIQNQPQRYRLDGPQKLRILHKEEDADLRIAAARGLLEELMADA
jgi:transcription-repair coupling factor (superfamily II helicase)